MDRQDVPGTGGQDHLGLGSVSSDQILPTLSPGINVLTVHPRYRGFYTFLLDEFWRRDDLPRTRAAWVRFFRPRDFVYALAIHLCDRPEHAGLDGIVSTRKTGPLAAQRRRPSYAYDADYIQESLGGHRPAYYRAVMAELGFLYPGGAGLPYPVDVPTDNRGKRRRRPSATPLPSLAYYREHFDGDHDAVPFEVVAEFGRRACLCQLQRPDAPTARRSSARFSMPVPVPMPDARRSGSCWTSPTRPRAFPSTRTPSGSWSISAPRTPGRRTSRQPTSIRRFAAGASTRPANTTPSA